MVKAVELLEEQKNLDPISQSHLTHSFLKESDWSPFGKDHPEFNFLA